MEPASNPNVTVASTVLSSPGYSAIGQPDRFSNIWFGGVDPPRRTQCQTGSSSAARTKRYAAKDRARRGPERPNPFAVWLFEQVGLDASAYRPAFLERRISACLRALLVNSTEAAQAVLEQKPERIRSAVDTILIGVSSFFRDAAVFEQLRRKVLPDLLGGRDGLRVCSVGCSEGHELYSTAILVDSLGRLCASHFLGLDFRPEAVSRAHAGRFDGAELEPVPPEWRDRYFAVHGHTARIAPSLRESARWEEADCFQWEFGRDSWDLVLFRNVAIYLDQKEVIGLWKRLIQGLRPGGVLVTGKAEQPPNELPLKLISRCLYARLAAPEPST
ncbi:MAG: protein-glutamate O-methyltransferase CheR [Verrucomicrobiia bacterium]